MQNSLLLLLSGLERAGRRRILVGAVQPAWRTRTSNALGPIGAASTWDHFQSFIMLARPERTAQRQLPLESAWQREARERSGLPCLRRSGSATACGTTPLNSPAANNGVATCAERWDAQPSLLLAMKRPAIWIRNGRKNYSRAIRLHGKPGSTLVLV